MSAILGLGAKVVVTYAADTSDLKAKLKSLSGDEKKFAEEQLKHAEARNKALEGQKKGFEMLATGIAASAAGIALAIKGLEAYGKSSAAAGEQVKKMKEGISDAFDSFAASIGRTVMAFEPLISGVAALVGILGDLQLAGPAAIGALGYAISGNPKVAALLAAVGLAMQAGGAVGDFVNRNPISDPEVQNTVDTGVAFAGAYGRGGTGASRYYAQEADKERRAAEQRAAQAARAAAADPSFFGGDETGVGLDDVRRMASRVDNAIGRLVSESLGVDQWSGGIKWNKAGKDENGFTVTNPFRTNGDPQSGVRTGSGIGDVSINKNEDGGLGIASGINLDLLKKAGSDIFDNLKAKGADTRHKLTESKLAGIFGPLDEFNAYTMAFDTLSGAVGSAMTAWIDGSMSAGKAFKAFVGEAVKGIAIQMAMEALKHGAYAIGALAMGDAKGAALHGTSAAKFAAGAIVAAGAAKSLGGSSASVGSGPGAPSVGGSSGGYQQQGTQTIIAYGDSFAEDSPRQRLLRAGRIVSRVSGTSGIEYA